MFEVPSKRRTPVDVWGLGNVGACFGRPKAPLILLPLIILIC
jgi:hypothetical protein